MSPHDGYSQWTPFVPRSGADAVRLEVMVLELQGHEELRFEIRATKDERDWVSVHVGSASSRGTLCVTKKVGAGLKVARAGIGAAGSGSATVRMQLTPVHVQPTARG